MKHCSFIIYITGSRNLIHILLYWQYKELFSYSLNNGVSAFYVFTEQSGSVPVSFIYNKKSGVHTVRGNCFKMSAVTERKLFS